MWSSCFVLVEKVHSLPCGFVGFHFSTTDGLWNLVSCSHLRSQFPVACVNLLFARLGCVQRPFQFSSRIYQGFFVFMVILDQRSRFLSVIEHCRVLASRFSILVFSILSGFPNTLRQGIAASIGTSSFFPAFLMISHSCFSFFWAAFPILVHFRPTWSGLVVVWTFVSLSRATCTLWEVSLSIEWILWVLSENRTNFCSNRRSSNHQYVSLAWRPDQYK